MRRKLAIIGCIILLLVSGCSMKEMDKDHGSESGSGTGNVQTSSGVYLIENTSQNMISLQIPKLDAMTQEECDFLEKFITNKVFERSGEIFQLKRQDKDISSTKRDYTGYYIDVDSQVTYRTDDCVSVVFQGLYNKKSAAHPTHLLYAVNYHPDTLEVVSFDETYLLTDELYDTFARLAVANILEGTGGVWPSSWGPFDGIICTKESFFTGMKAGKEFDYYYTATGVVISYPVTFVMGDHLEVEIPYESLPLKEDNCRLVVNGKDISDGLHIKMKAKYCNTEIPLLAVLKELGAQVQWKDSSVVTAQFKGSTFEIDTSKEYFGILIPPGTRQAVRKVVDQEIIIDSNSVESFLFSKTGAYISVDYDKAIIFIDFIE